jgi:hypothetical protein
VAVVTEEQHRTAERLALQVLASITLGGQLEEERQEAVKSLRQNLGAAPMTAPIHRATDMHPRQEETQ